MVSTATIAYSQTTAPSQPRHRAATSAAITTQASDLRASKLIGGTVYDVQNCNIGDVKDVVLDRQGNVVGAVINVGAFLGMIGKYVEVRVSDLKMDNGRLT